MSESACRRSFVVFVWAVVVAGCGHASGLAGPTASETGMTASSAPVVTSAAAIQAPVVPSSVGPVSSAAAPPPLPPTSNRLPHAPTPPAATTSAKPSPAVIGPKGLGVFVMGMSIAQAKAADPGIQIVDNPGSQCATAQVPGAELLFNGSHNYLPNKGGLSYISPTPALPAANGIKLGETLAQLRKDFPSLRESTLGGHQVAIRALPGIPAEYWIVLHGNRLSDMSLNPTSTVSLIAMADSQACFE